MRSDKKEIQLDFSNISAGVCTAKPAESIGEHQVQKAYNVIIKELGWDRSPGYLGIKSTALFTSYLRGLDFYRSGDNDTLIAVFNSTVYAVNTTTGVLTSLFSIGGTGEAYMVNAYNKGWMVNGNKLIKIESGSLAYQVGIDAPAAGASAAAATGGTLPNGAYEVYIGYSRQVGGIDKLYSIGLSLGTVTLTTGNNTIAITAFPDSSDPQVGNKVVWIKKPAGTVHYWFAQTGDNTTTSASIASDTSNTSLVYETEAMNNNVPSLPEYVLFMDNRIWYSKGNAFYWSLKMTTAYQGERFFDTNTGTMPDNIKGMFQLGEHLYFNTIGGIIRQPYGDVNSRFEVVDTRWHFKYFRTISHYGSDKVIGLTNDGVRIFTASGFADFDLSRDIKPEISKAYNGASSNLEPCGKVIRNNNRTEYVLSFRDVNINAGFVNTTWVLNLDNMAIYDHNKYKTPWEQHQHGFGYVAADQAGTVYYGQSSNEGSTIFKESQSEKQDNYIYGLNGAFITTATDKEMAVWSRKVLPDMKAICRFFRAEILARAAYDITIEAIMDRAGASDSSSDSTTFSSGGSDSTFGTAVFGTGTFAIETPRNKPAYFKRTLAGKTVYLKATQTANDKYLNMVAIILLGIKTSTRFT